MITNVLVPTDFSDEAHKALRYAVALVRRCNAHLHIVNVSEVDFAMPSRARPETNPLISDTEDGRALKQRLHAVIGEGVDVTFHGRTGRAFDQIVRSAHELPADLIVMSTHGRTGLKRLFLGSTAERVVQYSLSPVLVVRRDEEQLTAEGQPLAIESILVPVDFSSSSAEGVRYAIDFARAFGARLVLFHSFEAPQFLTTDRSGHPSLPPTREATRAAAEDQMRQFVKSFNFDGVDFETQIMMGRAAEAICDYAIERKSDLIISSTHGRTGFMHVLIGSVAEHVVRYARTPVLIVPGGMRRAGDKTPLLIQMMYHGVD
jgi:nucleotide-binding universal stress UspA family protein